MADNETTADIIAAMRDEGHTGESSCLEWVGTKMRYYADRLEAACKRELSDFNPKCDWSVQEALDFANTLANHGWTRAANSDAASSCIYSLCRLLKERGNAAKLREALVQAELFVGNIVRHGHQTLVPGDKCTACDGAEELRDMICAALAEPRRNCDVGTAEEQYKRFMNMCNSKDVRQCAECSMRGFTPGCSRDRCFAKWAQMPYEEGGAK